MEVSLLQFLIVCPLVGLAGFVDAIAGGGGLISLPAYMIAGLPPRIATATNKVSACCGATIAVGKYTKSGFVPWKTAIPCMGCAILGAALGARITAFLDKQVFTWLMLVILPLTAIYIYFSRTIAVQKPPLSKGKTLAISCAAAFFLGIYDGFYGPGTGVFLLLLLTSLAHFDLKKATGLCRAVNWSSGLSSLVVYLVDGQVIVPLGLTAGLFSIVGSYLGARVFEKKGAVAVKPLILVVVAIFFVKVLLEVLGVA